MSIEEAQNSHACQGRQAPLEEGLDYYIEQGRYVFTDYFLTRRGYCCKNGCRHCPYGFKLPLDSPKAH
jgi:hypothetical protein